MIHLFPVLLASGIGIYGDLPDAIHAWAVHDRNRPRPSVVEVDAKGIPSDAVVLFDGREATYRNNWRSEKHGDVPTWKYEDGEIVSRGGSIASIREFGDCQVHVEWRAPDDENPQHGNSGVYLMNLYEVQIINSHEITPGRYHSVIRSGDEQAGSVYGQKPPLVNPLRKPGAWQAYDIVFHQPVYDETGRLLSHGTLTVFINGVLVQDHRKIEGPTEFCNRARGRVHASRGPLQLQDHNGNVRFRSVWLRELKSPRVEDVVSGTPNCDPQAVALQRRLTAEKLLGELADHSDPFERLQCALEMLSYSNARPFLEAATSLADAEVEFLASADEKTVERHRAVLRVSFERMQKTNCLPREWKLTQKVSPDLISAKMADPAICAGELRISVFAAFIRRIAKERGVSKAAAAACLYDLGVRGFDCGPDEDDLEELAATKLHPINFYFFPKWLDEGASTRCAKCLALAQKYGVPRIMTVPPDFTGAKDEESEFKDILNHMKKFVADAGKIGITVTIEDFGGTRNCCSYAKYLKRLLDEIPEIMFALDSGNLHYAGRGENILDLMAYAKGRIGHVHLKDQSAAPNNRTSVSLGLGVVPNERIVKAMSASGYDGWYTLENPVGDVYTDSVRQTAVLKSWLSPNGQCVGN